MSRLRLVVLLVALGTLAVYLPVSHEKFSLYDDNDYVTENPVVQNGLTWSGIQWAFTTWHAANWHPITWISHMLDCQWFSLNPGPPHDINVLFHAANAMLLLILLLRLTGAFWPAAFAAALFAWHPLHVESVAWISERKDVLSTFFELLALLSYTRYVTCPHLTLTLSPPIGMGAEREQLANVNSRTKATKPATSPCYRSLFYWLALLFFALGLMSKPMLVTLPFVMLLLDYWPLQRFNLAGIQRPSPHPDPLPSHQNGSGEGTGSGHKSFHGSRSTDDRARDSLGKNVPEKNLRCLMVEKWPFFALAAASCVVTFLAQHHGGAVIPLEKIPLALRFENVPVAYALYLLKLFWPARLAVFYPLPASIPALCVAAAITILIFITATAWLARKKLPYFLVGWLWFLGSLVPVIGLVQVGGASMADRYAYFPSIGIFLAVAMGIRDAATKFHLSRQIIAAGAVLILAVCLALTHRQLGYWRDDVSLFTHTLNVTPDNDTARVDLGVAYENAGEKPEAMEEYQQAAQINPDNVQAHNNLANVLDETGHPGEALTEYQRALQLEPDSAAAHDNLGTLYVELGQFDEGEKQYAQAAQLDPTSWHTPFLMGKAFLKQGRDADAVPYLQHAVELAPDNPHVLNFVAEVFASDADAKVRNGTTALALATKANDLTGGMQPDVLDTLAMAYAETGQFAQAQEAAADGFNVATSVDLYKAEEIGRRSKFYQNNQPFRQSFTNAPPTDLPKE